VVAGARESRRAEIGFTLDRAQGKGGGEATGTESARPGA
jgi:hypothetical protein